jgi:hypothetical protein
MLQSGVAWHVLGPHNMVWRDVDQRTGMVS